MVRNREPSEWPQEIKESWKYHNPIYIFRGLPCARSHAKPCMTSFMPQNNPMKLTILFPYHTAREIEEGEGVCLRSHSLHEAESISRSQVLNTLVKLPQMPVPWGWNKKTPPGPWQCEGMALSWPFHLCPILTLYTSISAPSSLWLIPTCPGPESLEPRC